MGFKQFIFFSLTAGEGRRNPWEIPKAAGFPWATPWLLRADPRALMHPSVTGAWGRLTGFNSLFHARAWRSRLPFAHHYPSPMLSLKHFKGCQRCRDTLRATWNPGRILAAQPMMSKNTLTLLYQSGNFVHDNSRRWHEDNKKLALGWILPLL